MEGEAIDCVGCSLKACSLVPTGQVKHLHVSLLPTCACSLQLEMELCPVQGAAST